MGNTQSTRRDREGAEVREQSNDTAHDTSRSHMEYDEHSASTSESATTSRQIRNANSRHSGLSGSLRHLGARNTQEELNSPSTRHPAEDEDSTPLPESDDAMLQFSDEGSRQTLSGGSGRAFSRLSEPTVRRMLSISERRAENDLPREGRSRLGRRASIFDRSTSTINNSRFSLRDTFRRRADNTGLASREIRGPFPIDPSDSLLSRDIRQLERPHSSISASPSDNREDLAEPSRLSRRNRLSRMRNSIHVPLAGLFGTSRNRDSMHVPRSPTPHPGQSSARSDLTSLSDSLHSVRHDRESAAHELDAVEPETRHLLSASRIASGMTSIRRFHGLRSRSTRLIRRGEHPPLSQVLQLAAAAIAAQLSGQTSGSDGPRPLGGEAFDGSIQNFVQTLQEAASAQAGENIDLNATDGDLPPVNFMRVFQFPNDENGIPIGPPQNRSSTRANAEGGPDSDRSVTLVLVGVRSMPNMQDGSGHGGGAPGPSLDALLSLPFMPPANILRNGSSGALFRRSDTRTRGSRRHSMTNFNFPTQYDGHHLPGSRTGSHGITAGQASLPPNHAVPISISESPPGPNPPPSTPADIRSGHVTPVQRPSSASAAQTSLLPHLDEDSTQFEIPASSLEPTTTAASAASHQRRRSDSDFARRPELGSGAARRNGVVEPDRTAGGSGRSWLIYVVGTNVSPDHPAFTMPSLFTDNPSYEDMQMLSTLLGPVKPPVATQDDVSSAGGTYRLIAQDRLLIAVPYESEGLDSIAMVVGDRCLICLCDYEAEEQVRRLNSCSHIFHRDCIDEWLTTGRNSCPMCRGQGVKEHSTDGNPSPSAEQSI